MTQRHILVTGGSGGLGVHVTRALLDRGDAVVVPVVDDAQAARLRDTLGSDASRVVTTPADLLREDDVARVVALGPALHGVVHLVGGFSMGHTVDVTLDAFRQQLDLNLVTAFLVIKHALARMLPLGHGRIVTVGSRAAVQPGAQQAAYASSKAALVAMTQSIAEETRGTDVTANCVLPSTIDTPANRAAMGVAKADTWVKPERLAATIAFLCSEAAGDIRGAAVPVYASA